MTWRASYQDTNQVTVTFCVPTGTKAHELRAVATDFWRADPGQPQIFRGEQLPQRAGRQISGRVQEMTRGGA
jgi:hypothetical protein